MVDEPKTPIVVNGVECRSFKEMILYKMDRTLAIAGIILLGVWAMNVKTEIPALPIATAAVGALSVYVGGRVQSK